MPRRSGLLPPLLLVALAMPLAPSPARAADPFYERLLVEGSNLDERGEHAAAARTLGLACFGLLEEPDRLTACLVRLGLAQAGAHDSDGFRDSFGRLTEVDGRFGSYARAELSPALRHAYEERLTELVPPATLAAAPAFAALARSKQDEAISRLPARERRRELERRIAQEPDNSHWRLLAADLALADGRSAEALAQAQTVLAKEPANREALCWRGLAEAAKQDCKAASTDLAGCARARRERRFAQPLLACEVTLADWVAARALAADLLQEVRSDAAVAALLDRVARAPAAAAPAATIPPPAPPAAESAPEAKAALPGDDRARLDRARRLLQQAKTAGDLTEALDLARGVADANGESTEAQYLAAQIAYRSSKWTEAVTYFKRGGDPGDGQPVLLFYLAVSEYEAGDRDAAAAALKRCLPRLDHTPFVDAYVQKILGDASS